MIHKFTRVYQIVEVQVKECKVLGSEEERMTGKTENEVAPFVICSVEMGVSLDSSFRFNLSGGYLGQRE